MNAISLNSISFNAARVVGPLVAGFVMTWAGLGWCFALNALGSLHDGRRSDARSRSCRRATRSPSAARTRCSAPGSTTRGATR